MQMTVNGEDLKGTAGNGEAVRRVHMMDFESETRRFSSETTVEKEKDGDQEHVDMEEKSKSNFTSGEKLGEDSEVWSFMDMDGRGKENGRDMLFEPSVVCEGDSRRNKCQNDEIRSLVQLNGNDRSENDGNIADVDTCDINFKSQGNEDVCNRKRKRECILELLNWVTKVAKDPCNPVIGSLPEKSKWKYFGNEQPGKYVLLVRRAMMVKRNANSSVEQSIWQKKQKMHPTMYDDHSVSGTSRYSQRIVSANISRAVLTFKKSQAQSCSKSTFSDTRSVSEYTFGRKRLRLADSLADLWLKNYSHMRIPVGIYFQAGVPEWTEKAYASDSKWLGTRVWPQEKGANRNSLIERDPTGFGRHDLCGCEFTGSFECVRFHVSEKGIRLKLELGMAFYHWHIDKMGEEVALSWKKAEEINFEAIVRSNPPSQGKCLWEEIRKFFPRKKREQLVSYYFNVFLLRRRGQQNRYTPIEISSDDDDLEFEITTNCSGQRAVKSPKPSYCSLKKTHLNFREYSRVG